MPITKTIVCLANSRKLSGRCIAGKEWSGDEFVDWIRPVSSRQHEEVSEHERQYSDGSDPKVLDVIKIPLLRSNPKTFQSENWVLDPEQYWEKLGSLKWDDLDQLVDPEGTLWLNCSSTYNGQNDEIPLISANLLDSSLKFIRVEDLTLRVFAPGAAFGNPKRRVQGQFSWAKQTYKLWVTDPDYERTYLAKENGNYQVGQAFLTVSLGEPLNDMCYKLIAAVVEAPTP